MGVEWNGAIKNPFFPAERTSLHGISSLRGPTYKKSHSLKKNLLSGRQREKYKSIPISYKIKPYKNHTKSGIITVRQYVFLI